MRKQNTFFRILSYAMPYRGWLLCYALFAVIAVAMNMLLPVFIGQAIDQMVQQGLVDFQTIGRMIFQIVVCLFLHAIFLYSMTYGVQKVTFLMVLGIRKEMMKKIVSVEIAYLDTHPQGDLITRIIQDVEVVSDGFVQTFQQCFSGFLTIIVTLIIMFVLCYPLAIMVVVLTPFSLGTAMFIAKNSAKIFQKQNQCKGEMGTFLNEYLQHQEVVFSFQQEEQVLSSFEAINQTWNTIGFKAQFYGALINPATRVINAIIYALIAACGAYFVFQGQFGLTVGTLFSFLAFASQYTKPFNEVSGVIAELQNSFASARRIFVFLDAEEQGNDAHLPTFVNAEGSVRFDQVSFSYDASKTLLKDVSFQVQPGQQIAIVGPTGCGKTTLINLLMRFYTVNEGMISLDNTDITSITRASLRQQFGMVLQDSWIFKGTIRENICYGKNDADEASFEEACKNSYVYRFVEKLPHGYDTVISEEEGCSQGQKQLICIARLMLCLPSLLILDEATSSIDTMTEQDIQKAFQKMMEGRTTFIIAHRLATIRKADCIFVMHQGNIIEKGTHETLLSARGFYWDLYQSQFKII